jgi:HPt (histidine-containing phosphotransfer) domain-containing protein
MDDYLSKPFSHDQLASILSRWLPASTEVLPEPAPPIETGSLNTGVIDLKVLETLRNMRPGLLGRVLIVWLQESCELMQSIRSAIRDADCDALFMATHSFKNSCANVGAMRLSALMRELENMAREKRCAEAMGHLNDLESAYGRAHAELTNINQHENEETKNEK